MANTPTKTRLSLLKDWKNDLPAKFLWTIDFATRDGRDTATLGRRVNSVFNQYERREGRDWPIEESLIRDQTDSSGENGYLLAQSIAFPTEQYNISTGDELVGSGGYLRGYISGERSPYGSQNKLDITFLETNTDIIDFFIKPWIIANSHKGLIEDGETDKDIKCNITVVLYTRNKEANSTRASDPSKEFDYKKNTKLQPRKKIVFFNAVPYTVTGDGVSYGELSINEINKTVAFAFSHYNTVELFDTTAEPITPRGSFGARPPSAVLSQPPIPGFPLLSPTTTPSPAATIPGRQNLQVPSPQPKPKINDPLAQRAKLNAGLNQIAGRGQALKDFYAANPPKTALELAVKQRQVDAYRTDSRTALIELGENPNLIPAPGTPVR